MYFPELSKPRGLQDDLMKIWLDISKRFDAMLERAFETQEAYWQSLFVLNLRVLIYIGRFWTTFTSICTKNTIHRKLLVFDLANPYFIIFSQRLCFPTFWKTNFRCVVCSELSLEKLFHHPSIHSQAASSIHYHRFIFERCLWRSSNQTA